MAKYRIIYSTEITDEELKDVFNFTLEDFLWQELFPEGDDWRVEVIDDDNGW
jgi:hypothetical protein